MRTRDALPDAIRKLREGKKTLRRARRTMTLPEKVRQVVQLQAIHLKAILHRRQPTARERVWQINKHSHP